MDNTSDLMTTQGGADLTSAKMSSQMPTSTEDYDADVGITWDDATWVLICTFIIFTMQSGGYILYTVQSHITCYIFTGS